MSEGGGATIEASVLGGGWVISGGAEAGWGWRMRAHRS